MEEGVIKFNLHQLLDEVSISDECFKQLSSIRSKLFDLKMIGVDEDGIGYGNISIRSKRDSLFYITASQTGGINKIKKAHVSEVVKVQMNEHSLTFNGMPPSSESISHFALINSLSHINAVIHIHHQELWESSKKEHPFFTPKEIEYGSKEMSLAIANIAQKCEHYPIIHMHGHQGGIIAFGHDLEEAFTYLLEFKSAYIKNLT